MAILPILCYPDPRLLQVAKPVQAVDARIKALVADMLETMYDAQGIGLAATQVDVHERLVVIDVSEERNEPLVLINPEIVWASAEKHLGEEGCLSVPDLWHPALRYPFARVVGIDLDGAEIELSGEGLMAQALQHETDHLDGMLYLERLSPEQRRIAMREVRESAWF